MCKIGLKVLFIIYGFITRISLEILLPIILWAIYPKPITMFLGLWAISYQLISYMASRFLFDNKKQ